MVYVLQPEVVRQNPTYFPIKIRHFKKITGNLRPQAVQSVRGCCDRPRIPPVAALVQKPPLTNKISNLKKYLLFTSSGRAVGAGVLRPATYTPSVRPVQKQPLTFKIKLFIKILVIYVPQLCSRCRGVAPGYIHPQSPPRSKTTPNL